MEIPLNTLWEVAAPNGEILLFWVTDTKCISDPISVARAIPVTDWIRLTLPGDKIVGADNDIFAAHCWLEGPVLVESLRQCLGSCRILDTIPPDKAKLSADDRAHEARFTRSLYERHDPVFRACWQKVFDFLDSLDE